MSADSVESTLQLPPALILVGGMGTRLRKVVSDRPKPMALAEGRPFLEWLVLYLKAQGLRELIFGSGYMAEMIEAHFGDGSDWGLSIRYSVEPEALGTGGAMRFARDKLGNGPFFLVMGDTLFAIDYAALWAFHREHNADLSLALHYVQDNSRYGGVELDDARIAAFTEKPATGYPSWINGGVLLVEPCMFDIMPAERVFSFEQTVMPDAIARGFNIFGFKQNGYFLDIGLPETYGRLQADLPELLEKGLFG